ncbi:MAG: aminoacyl-tRNA hydrolase [Spirochaetota bacterium]|nr:aminoacyl-tRNA hydrolase [Spirochaetota bacterium]
MKLIIGCGNPGEKHSNNRQNIGFKVIDILGNNENIEVKTRKKKSLIGRGSIGKEKVVLLKPQTFVNLIGEAVLYIASFVRADVSDIICIFEDPSLPLGEMRVDYMLSTFNHAAISSITKALKSDRFAKVRVGVGEAPSGMSLEKYLLKDFTDEENLILIDILNKTEEVVRMLLTHKVEDVQDKYNPEGAPKIVKRQIKKLYIQH